MQKCMTVRNIININWVIYTNVDSTQYKLPICLCGLVVCIGTTTKIYVQLCRCYIIYRQYVTYRYQYKFRVNDFIYNSGGSVTYTIFVYLMICLLLTHGCSVGRISHSYQNYIFASFGHMLCNVNMNLDVRTPIIITTQMASIFCNVLFKVWTATGSGLHSDICWSRHKWGRLACPVQWMTHV